ncbi:MAG TPA: hypothetical protein VF316_08245 [Polyangiaceae bacterium]
MPDDADVAGAAPELAAVGAAEADAAPEASGAADAEAAAAEADAFGGAPASFAPPTCARTVIEKSVGSASANTVMP